MKKKKGVWSLLQALDETGRLICFTDKRSHSEWRYLQKSGRFRCPICNQQVRMRLGTKRRWHFAHQKSETCPSGGEGESDEHVRGKQLLFHWAARQNKATQLETYLRESKQRPDVYIESSSPLALEFQCATLSAKTLYERNTLYARQGISPVWIFGGSRLKRKRRQMFQIQQFEWYGLRHAQRELFFIYLDAHTENVCLLRHVVAVLPSLALATPSFIALERLTLSDLLQPPSMSVCYTDSLSAYRRQVKNNLYRNRSLAHLLATFQLTDIPLTAGWPLPTQRYLQVSPFLWQTSFIHAYLCHALKSAPRTLTQIAVLLSSCLRQFRHPFKPYCDPKKVTSQLAREYLALLQAFGLLKKIAPAAFIKSSEEEILSCKGKEKEQRFLHCWNDLLLANNKRTSKVVAR
ncbi:hypothetical protein BC8716_15020 [Shouchella clausii]|nr:hypothetical protein BC8716_15020 [Shouchella clausii]QNM43555.1 hypothetical protein DUT88_11880 [Shouchella clausii]